MNLQPAAKSRTPLILLGTIVVLVALALVLVLTRGAETPADPRSPEGTVQKYVTALLAGDQKNAALLLTPGATKDCPAGGILDEGNLRVGLVASSVSGASATVTVSISETLGSGPFGLGDGNYQDSFTLVKTNDVWLISMAPWPLLACTDTAVKTP